jgi:DNA-directed RNA polymerase specialized sigma24 family protein
MSPTPPQDLSPDDPSRLALRLQQGDEAALQTVIRTLGPRVAAGLKKRHPALHAEDIEDVLSLASYRLWQSRIQFDPARGSLASWFFVIADNVARDVLRKKNRTPEVTVDLDRLAIPDRKEPGAGAEACIPDGTDLKNVLGGLASVDQCILAEHARAGGQGPWAAGLAQDLGVGAGAIRVRCHRLRQKVRQALEVHGCLPTGSAVAGAPSP